MKKLRQVKRKITMYDIVDSILFEDVDIFSVPSVLLGEVDQRCVKYERELKLGRPSERALLYKEKFCSGQIVKKKPFDISKLYQLDSSKYKMFLQLNNEP